MNDMIKQYKIEKEPYYRTVADEVDLYEAAYSVRMPMMLKGPTGCGKTRFVEYMAWKLKRPLITVACNEDMTASDLVGRFLAGCAGYALAGRPLGHRCTRRCNLLPGRSGRSTPGYNGRDPSADR